MTYAELELDSHFAINSISAFDSVSESNSHSDSDSDFSSAFMNLEICIFLFYICIPLNKP